MEDRERSNGVDRRKFIKGAATVAWATPLVLTVGATSAHAQVPSPPNCLGATGRPQGCPCTTSSNCAGGCCCSAGGPIGAAGGCTSASNCANLGGECL